MTENKRILSISSSDALEEMIIRSLSDMTMEQLAQATKCIFGCDVTYEESDGVISNISLIFDKSEETND